MTSNSAGAERSPLLQSSTQHAPKSIPPFSKTCPRPWLTVVLPCFLMFGLAGASAIIFNTAAYQIGERIICRGLYDHVVDPLTDLRCKNEDVQTELSLLNAMVMLFDLIMCVVCAIPFGIAADMYGRKPLVILNHFSVGFYLAMTVVVYQFPSRFPLRLIWFLPILQFVGGATSQCHATLYTSICDVTLPEQRSSLFYYASAANGLGALLAGPITYFCMEVGDFFTLYLGLAVYLLTILVACTIHETLPYSQTTVEASITELAAEQPDPSQKSLPLFSQIIKPLIDILPTLHDVFWKNKKLALLMCSSFSATIGTYLLKFVLNQYIAKRFTLSWAKANLVVTIRLAVHFAVVLVLLPALDYWLTTKSVSPFHKNLWIVRVSLLILFVGMLVAGLADTLTPFISGLVGLSFGDGLEPAMRSFSVTIAGPIGTGVLFSVLGFLQAAAVLLVGPLMALTFKLGLHAGGVWLGLPLFVAAGLVGLAGLVIVLTKFEQPSQVVSNDEEEEVEDEEENVHDIARSH